MITVKELTKKYARKTAVDHISFQVQKGQIVGFLGPNGAGKTTTMRMLTCFLPPSSGQRNRGRIRRAGATARSQEAHRLSARNAAALSGNGDRRIPDFVGKLKGLSGAELQQAGRLRLRPLRHCRCQEQACWASFRKAIGSGWVWLRRSFTIPTC